MTLDERLALLMRTTSTYRVQACLDALRKFAAYYAEPSEDKDDPAVILQMLEERIK